MSYYYSHALVSNPEFSWAAARHFLPEPLRREFFLLGFQPEAMFLPYGALSAHTYIVGPSNCGKTSRAVVPIISQAIHAGKTVWCIDCKPDPGLWGHIRAEAKAAGRRVRLFSLQPGVPSEFSLDILGALSLNPRTPRQISQLLLGSLGLDAAAEPFFVSQNGAALTAAIERAKSLSFESIARELRTLVEGKHLRHAVHAMDVVAELADVPALNDKASGVNVAELLQSGDVCYFCLPVSTELKTTCATTAALLLKTVALASKDLGLSGRPCPRLTLAIDEFQEVASAGDLGNLLAQVRGIGSGVSLILSHQVQGQIQDEALQELLESLGVLIFFAPRAQAQKLMEWSGERIDVLYSGGTSSSQQGITTTRSWTQTIRSALPLNVIQEVNRLDGFAMAVIAGGPPTPIFLPHHVGLGEATRRERGGFQNPKRALIPTKTPGPKTKGTRFNTPPPRPTPFHAPQGTSQDTTRGRIQALFIELQDKTLVPRRRP